MALHGDLGTMPVTDLLQWVEATRKSGVVEFRGPSAWKKIFFREGQILFASSSREEERLGRFLIRSGRLREEDLEACLEENERTGVKLTQILEDRGLVSHGVLYQEVGRLIHEILRDLLLWTRGTFVFQDGSLPAAASGPLALKTGQVLFEVLTRLDEERRDGAPARQPVEEPRPRRRRRGRAVFKVDDRRFPLPGSYEETEGARFHRVDDSGEEPQEEPT